MANSLSRYSSTNGMTRLPDLMDRLFQESFVLPAALDRAGNASRPGGGVNLYEADDTYVLEAALPGLKSEDLDIQVMGRELTIKGTIQSTAPEKANWIWRGIEGGSVQETFSLPAEVQSDKVEATYVNGILTVRLPKAEHLRPKSIKVSVTQ